MGETKVDNGDGSTTTTYDDGSHQVDWGDGTSVITYSDGQVVTTWPDGRTLSQLPDGSRTLILADGTHCDPDTGHPIAGGSVGGSGEATEDAGPEVPAEGNSWVVYTLDILRAGKVIATEEELRAIVQIIQGGGEEAEAFLEFVEPIGAVVEIVLMFADVISALTSVERSYRAMGWCYGVMYTALGMGAVPEPTFANLLGPDQDELDKTAWAEGVSSGTNAAQNPDLVNRVKLRALYDNDPSHTLNAIWKKTAENNSLEHSYQEVWLSWPQPLQQ